MCKKLPFALFVGLWDILAYIFVVQAMVVVVDRTARPLLQSRIVVTLPAHADGHVGSHLSRLGWWR